MKNVSESALRHVLPNMLKEQQKGLKQNRTNQLYKDGVLPLPILPADPSIAYPCIYYNSTTNHIRAYIIGTGWVTVV